MEADKDQQTVVRYDPEYNPYDDSKLVATQTNESPKISSREPFNDAVKHQDIIAGYQQNRTLSDYPRKARSWVKLYAIVVLLLLIGGFVWDYSNLM